MKDDTEELTVSEEETSESEDDDPYPEIEIDSTALKLLEEQESLEIRQAAAKQWYFQIRWSEVVLMGILICYGFIVWDLAVTNKGYLATSILYRPETLPMWALRSSRISREIPWVPRNVSLTTVLDSLHYYLGKGRKYPCLCMHHLNVSKPLRVCSVATGLGHSPTIDLVNPIATGGSFDDDAETVYEHSVVCPQEVAKKRRNAVFITWELPTRKRPQVFNMFQNRTAHCLQMVLEEMSGVYTCD